MENYNKTQNSIFNLSVKELSYSENFKIYFWKLFPWILKTSVFGLALLLFQAFFVGTADLIGVSPKWSLLGSSLMFVTTFAGLAIWGGLKEKIMISDSEPELQETVLMTEPICKILTILRNN